MKRTNKKALFYISLAVTGAVVCFVLGAAIWKLTGTLGDLIFESLSTVQENIEKPNDSTENVTADIIPKQPPKEQMEVTRLNFEAVCDESDELVFSVKPKEFISTFNAIYQEYYGEDYLPPIAEWVKLTVNTNCYSKRETVCYRFHEKPGVTLDPEIELYMSNDKTYIQIIALEFNDHGYTDWGYEMYAKDCFYVLKLLFPDLSDMEIQSLFQALSDLAYSDEFFIKDGTEYGDPSFSLPAVYYDGCIGVCPYYEMGVVVISIMPVTDDYLYEMASSGTKTIELSELIQYEKGEEAK